MFVHYSIDDVVGVFEELTKKQPDSIFELSFFAHLQHLHNKYGLVVSCYCFFRNGVFLWQIVQDAIRPNLKEILHGFDSDFMVILGVKIMRYRLWMNLFVNIEMLFVT